MASANVKQWSYRGHSGRVPSTASPASVPLGEGACVHLSAMCVYLSLRVCTPVLRVYSSLYMCVPLCVYPSLYMCVCVCITPRGKNTCISFTEFLSKVVVGFCQVPS